MKNQHKNIEKLLKHGFLVEIKDLEDGRYCIASEIDCDNDLRTSTWEVDIKKCYEKLRHDFLLEEFVNKLDIEIKAVPREYKVIPDDSKVDIIDCKELRRMFDDSYPDKAIEMIGQKGLEVSEFNDIDEGQSYEIYDREHTALYTFPAWAVAPHIEEEEETVEIDGNKYIKKEVEKAIKKLKKVE